MAATATDTAQTTTIDAGRSRVSLGEVLVQPTAPSEGRVDPPGLPRGWQHAGLVESLAAMPRERRETMLAAGFALVAGVWAPLGILAFLARSTTLFLLASLAVATVLFAPRPALQRVSAASPRERATALSRQLAAAVTSAGRSARPGLERFGRRVGAGLDVAIDWTEQQWHKAGPALASARDWTEQQWHRAGPAIAEGRDWGRQQLRGLRDWGADLRPEPQSSPRSAR
jgi:hypothetical protein